MICPPEKYDTKLVVFFDILGWKNKIDRAGSDKNQIGLLKTVIEIFNAFGKSGDGDAKDRLVTSFSDNVVCSTPCQDEDIPHVIEALAQIQLGAACMGFFIRGAITVGEIYHSETTVFGPALNRAYELESKHSKMPRIILDPNVGRLNIKMPLIEQENDFRIINPFLPDIASYFSENQLSAEQKAEALSKIGLDAENNLQIETHIDGGSIIYMIMLLAMREYVLCASESAKEKMKWLIDRAGKSIQILNIDDKKIRETVANFSYD